MTVFKESDPEILKITFSYQDVFLFGERPMAEILEGLTLIVGCRKVDCPKVTFGRLEVTFGLRKVIC